MHQPDFIFPCMCVGTKTHSFTCAEETCLATAIIMATCPAKQSSVFMQQTPSKAVEARLLCIKETRLCFGVISCSSLYHREVIKFRLISTSPLLWHPKVSVRTDVFCHFILPAIHFVRFHVCPSLMHPFFRPTMHCSCTSMPGSRGGS